MCTQDLSIVLRLRAGTSPRSPARATAGSHGSQVAACWGKQLQMDVKGRLKDKSKQQPEEGQKPQ